MLSSECQQGPQSATFNVRCTVVTPIAQLLNVLFFMRMFSSRKILCLSSSDVEPPTAASLYRRSRIRRAVGTNCITHRTPTLTPTSETKREIRTCFGFCVSRSYRRHRFPAVCIGNVHSEVNLLSIKGPRLVFTLFISRTHM